MYTGNNTSKYNWPIFILDYYSLTDNLCGLKVIFRLNFHSQRMVNRLLRPEIKSLN